MIFFFSSFFTKKIDCGYSLELHQRRKSSSRSITTINAGVKIIRIFKSTGVPTITTIFQDIQISQVTIKSNTTVSLNAYNFVLQASKQV